MPKCFFITYGGQQQPRVDLFSLQLCLVVYPSCLSRLLGVSQSVQHSHQDRSAVVGQNHLLTLESIIDRNTIVVYHGHMECLNLFSILTRVGLL